MKKRVCELVPGDCFRLLGSWLVVCDITKGRLNYRYEDREYGGDSLGAKSQQIVEVKLSTLFTFVALGKAV